MDANKHGIEAGQVLKNIRNDLYCQYLPAPVCGLNSFNNASQWLNSFFSVNLW
jgi:hypothetical protein